MIKIYHSFSSFFIPSFLLSFFFLFCFFSIPASTAIKTHWGSTETNPVRRTLLPKQKRGYTEGAARSLAQVRVGPTRDKHAELRGSLPNGSLALFTFLTGPL